MSRRSRERANARPWEQEPDDQPEHDDTERCPFARCEGVKIVLA